MENDSGGDPEGGFRFVRPTLRSLSEQLAGRASHITVSRLLYGMGISPRINIKRFTGPDHPDRDVQFRYILEMPRTVRGGRLARRQR